MSCTFTTATPRDVIKWASVMLCMLSKSCLMKGGVGWKLRLFLRLPLGQRLGLEGMGDGQNFRPCLEMKIYNWNGSDRYNRSHSRFLSLSHTHSHTLSHTHTHTLSFSLSRVLFHSFCCCEACTEKKTFTLITSFQNSESSALVFLSLWNSLSLSYTLSLSLSFQTDNLYFNKVHLLAMLQHVPSSRLLVRLICAHTLSPNVTSTSTYIHTHSRTFTHTLTHAPHKGKYAHVM